jgi:integrase
VPLKLVRRSRSPFWIIRGTLRRIRVEETTGVADRRAAEEIRAKREAEILAESVYGRRATATFAEAALSYVEFKGPDLDTRFLKAVVDHFRTTPLARIDQDALDKGARKLFPKGSPSTRNRQFYTPASAVLRHAAKRRWCPPPLIERPEEPEGRVRWLHLDEADRLIAAASGHLRPLLVFMFYTGARTGEALWLDWRDVDLSRAHVTFPETKNGEARGVGLHPRVIAALANLAHREGEVFRRPDGKPYERPKTINDTSAGSRIKTAFKGAVGRAGLTDFTPHDCRHTWATWHYAKNRDLGALKRLGGWKTERMVMRYAHVNVEELADTINRLPGGNLGDGNSGKEKAS